MNGKLLHITHVTRHVNTAVMPWHCIRATGYPTWVFSCIFSISHDGCRDSNRKHAKTTCFQVRDFLPSLSTMNDPLSSVSYTNQDNNRNVQSSDSWQRLFVICWTLCLIILTHFLIYCLSFLLVTFCDIQQMFYHSATTGWAVRL
jgi:hypothetical protein